MSDRAGLTAEDRASKRAKEWTDLTWHVAVFVIVNVLLWSIDIAQGGGLNWAYWPTIGWGIAVAFHVASYKMNVSDQEGRKYQEFLAEERAKDANNQG